MSKLQRGDFIRRLNNMIINDIPIPEITDTQVLVKIEYVGICSSDIHYFHNGRCGDFIIKPNEDFMLGHECASIVTQIGKTLLHLKLVQGCIRTRYPLWAMRIL